VKQSLVKAVLRAPLRNCRRDGAECVEGEGQEQAVLVYIDVDIDL